MWCPAGQLMVLRGPDQNTFGKNSVITNPSAVSSVWRWNSRQRYQYAAVTSASAHSKCGAFSATQSSDDLSTPA
eukprot:816193-Prorocentrum_minimum.AAC.4